MAFPLVLSDGSGYLIDNPVVVYTTTTTASDGTFTVDISNAALANVYNVHATVIAASAALANAINASISTFSTTTVSGIAYRPTAAVLGLLGITAVGAGIQIRLTVIGSQ